MDGMQIALPILGIVGAAALTFYAVSFNEIREKSLRDYDESESENGGYRLTSRSRERRARRQASKNTKN
ncbi:uncharacterized protein [Cicer arietinum]|uniref:Uncharacterized protein LOC101512969 n=1 Tax=Cicer arietinum TaxID=3827 RepID=A0A1S2YJE3_CICAR|nr:uncharacterized protein LOC101512969 [Cicer arietinum]